MGPTPYWRGAQQSPIHHRHPQIGKLQALCERATLIDPRPNEKAAMNPPYHQTAL